MRDVRRRDHLAPGLLVKIVRPEDEATGLTVEGEIAELLSKEPFDPDGIVVKLVSGEVGRCLRVWEGGKAREIPIPEEPETKRETLPTYDAPRPDPYHWQFRIPETEVERKAREALAGASPREIDRMIQHHEEGLEAPLLRRFGIRSEELEKKTADLLKDLDDDALLRKLGAGPPPEARDEPHDPNARHRGKPGQRDPGKLRGHQRRPPPPRRGGR